jgi:hypothetical protein
MVRMAVEDRGLSQDPEVRLQSGGIDAQNSRTLGKIDRGLLHSELERVLDDDVEPLSDRGARPRADRYGNSPPRSSREGSWQKLLSGKNALPLPEQDRQARRLSRARQRPSARQYGHVEKVVRMIDVELGAAISAKIGGN